MMSEKDRFLVNLHEARNRGLVGLHFDFRPSRPMTPEEIFKALNEVDAAVEQGHRHFGWDGNMPR